MAIGKIWHKVVREILPHETRRKGIANTLTQDEYETIIALMDFFGCSMQLIGQTQFDLLMARYRIGDWLGMMIQNEGYGSIGSGESATKVLAHAYIKADGDIDKFIDDLRVSDYQVDTSWENIDLKEAKDYV